MSLDHRLRLRFADLEARGLTRSLPRLEARQGCTYELDGRRVIGFCSNDYLGLAERPPLPQTASVGATSSRLVSGDHAAHRDLECRLAELTGYADAVFFPSGFQLNVGALPALLEPGDTVFSDALNHASLIDGLRLSSANRVVLPHRQAPPPTPPEAPALRWWVTESVFSMDGDAVDHVALREYLEAGHCAYVDEAHAIGLFSGGRGYLHAHDIYPQVYVGTLGKAFGCAGAFVAASATICAWLRTRARSFVFTTGPSPLLANTLMAQLEIVRGPEGDDLRQRLWTNVNHVARLFDLPSPVASPIFPIIVGDNVKATALAEALLELGVHVQPIRPPTVPLGTARLRVTITAAHTSEQIEQLVHALRHTFAAFDQPLRFTRGLT